MPSELRIDPDDRSRPTIGVFGFIRRIATFYAAYKRLTVLVVLGLVIEVAIDQALMPLGFGYLLDHVLPAKDWTGLIAVIAVLGVGTIAFAAAGIGRDYAVSCLGQRVLDDIRLRMFAHLQRLSAGFYTRTQTADVTARFGTDLASIQEVTFQGLPYGSRAALAFLLNGALLFAIEWRLATLTFVLLPLVLFGPWRLGRRSSQLKYASKAVDAQTLARVQENVHTQAIVKAFCMEGTLRKRFHTHLARYFQQAMWAQFIGYMMERTPAIGMTVFNLVVIAAGGVLCLNDDLSIGALVAFSALTVRLSQSIDTLMWCVPDLLSAGAGLMRVQELLNEPAEIQDAPDCTELPPLRDAIEFRNVSFEYVKGQPILRRLNLTLPKGKTVAIVGGSGSGKSTILNLVARFYDPSAGAVSFDGNDLRAVSQASLRSQIGVVLQESLLFDTSFHDNLRLAKPDALMDEIVDACKAAEIHDFIMAQPLGYDTLVGERGGLLSGGQRQRVAIARAIVANPAVLLLDESTSALDPSTEQAVAATLERLAVGRTVLAVTHRLSLVTKAHCIVVLDNGKVAEQGTHEELLARHGVYRQLWEKQAGFALSQDGALARVQPSKLRSIGLLQHVSPEYLDDIADLFQTEHYRAGRVIVDEGDVGDRFYLIVRGKVEVLRGPQQDRLAVLSDGDHFGEIALLRNAPRNATVRALVDSVLLSLPRQPFLNLLKRNPQARSDIERAVENRLGMTLAAR
jgi:ATP-binding cassette, subfamily B, bacterial